MSATWLPKVLRDAGQTVKTYDGWRVRGRPGAFSPEGVLVHHTGTPTSMARPAPTVAMCIAGRPDLNGPLCQVVLGFDGVWHVIAAGRANHAGTARASGPMPAGDGNAMYLGIEVDYSGSQDMGPFQYAALIEGSAAILRHLGHDEEHLRGHKETSSAGKWDPGRKGSRSPEYLMGGIRGDVSRVLVPKVRFELTTGEGRKLDESVPVAVGDRGPRLTRFLNALARNPELILAEFDHDTAKGVVPDVHLRQKDA